MLELASILILSVLAQWTAWRMKIPAILPLIFIGLAVGPLSTFITPDGQKLLDGDEIFTGDLLFSFVSISVGVILFEGGLTLKLSEIRHQAATVRNMLIFGPIVTLFGAGAAAHFLMDLSWRYAFLFSALIIVSGPTVVLPILRNVRPNIKINTVLKWEGILIDPIGALVAVLAYEFIRSGGDEGTYTFEALKEFFLTIASGIVVGGVAALFMRWAVSKNRIPGYLINVFSLGIVIFAFTFSELIRHEAGLMAATFMGIVLANLQMDNLKKILSFKEDISLLLVSVLFILLSSRIDMEQITKLGVNSIYLFIIVVAVIRPLYTFISTLGSNLNWRERLFISWIGPKGIVAAAVASLFSLQLLNDAKTPEAIEQAELILPLTFLVIVGTVVLQGSSAKPLAKWLKVEREDPRGFVIAGAGEFSRFIGRIIRKRDIPLVFADLSKTNIKAARNEGFEVFEGNILSDSIFNDIDFTPIGHLLAITSNSEVNSLACNWFQNEFGEGQVYRLVSRKELGLKDLVPPDNALYTGKYDYLALTQIARHNEEALESECSSETAYDEIAKTHHNRIVPLFVERGNRLIPIIRDLPAFTKGDILIYALRPRELDNE
jgi:NhaP-type Na+/H+ or K+/H+ antiporter